MSCGFPLVWEMLLTSVLARNGLGYIFEILEGLDWDSCNLMASNPTLLNQLPGLALWQLQPHGIKHNHIEAITSFSFVTVATSWYQT